MHKLYIFLIFVFCFSINNVFGQATLPDFTLKNTNGEISVLWLNQYPKQVNGISLQRSYDSTKNFTSIASIFNPQNTINGYTDKKTPYDQMYYRLFIGFDTGVYILTPSKKPELNNVIDYTQLIIEINSVYERNIQLYEERAKAQKSAAVLPAAKNPKKTIAKKNPVIPKESVEETVMKEVITYPSKRIFTDRDNNIIIKLPNTKANKYRIKFFAENYKPLFTVDNVAEDYFIIEKVNFNNSGWFLFEIFKNELLLEENKFFISKDDKSKR